MSLLGKILAVLNVLVAAGVVVLLALDTGQRRGWAYAVYQHDLYLDGLPADAGEKDADGVLQVNKLSSRAVADFIGPLGPGVPTQQAEVERVKGVLSAYVAAAPADPRSQEQKLALILRPLATTLSERENFTSHLTAPTGDPKQVQALQAQLDGLFDAALAPSIPPDGRPAPPGAITPEERKLRVSRLLLGLVDGLDQAARAAGAAEAAPAPAPGAAPGAAPAPAPAPAGDPLESSTFKRFVRVVGLRAAIRELDAQAALYEVMATQTDVARDADRDQFVAQYSRLLYEIQNLADDLQEQNRFLAAKKTETAKQKKLADDREELVKQLRQELQTLRDATQTRLNTMQLPLEKQLLDTLRRVREEGRLTAETARELRRLEGLTTGP